LPGAGHLLSPTGVDGEWSMESESSAAGAR
jgi:hypothetical protein